MSTTAQEPLVEPTTPTEPETEDKKEDKGTSQREYVVLEQRSQGAPWNEVARVIASDVPAALNSLGEKSNQTSSYVAVAERYWRPLSPKVETQTTITWQ